MGEGSCFGCDSYMFVCACVYVCAHARVRVRACACMRAGVCARLFQIGRMNMQYVLFSEICDAGLGKESWL
jgi:hypothetical protein